MADTFTKEKRSQIMAKVKALETKPEVKVRKFLFSQGFRYRKNVKSLPGTPDIVLPKFKTIVLIHGCFWHGHNNCEGARLPKTNIEYWQAKIGRNIERDRKKLKELKKQGWKVIFIWECEIKNKIKKESRFAKLLKQIKN